MVGQAAISSWFVQPCVGLGGVLDTAEQVKNPIHKVRHSF